MGSFTLSKFFPYLLISDTLDPTISPISSSEILPSYHLYPFRKMLLRISIGLVSNVYSVLIEEQELFRTGFKLSNLTLQKCS
jgi:hypothetical protein